MGAASRRSPQLSAGRLAASILYGLVGCTATGKAARPPSAAVPLASASWELAALAYLVSARPALPALALALLYSAAAISSSGWERCRWHDCCLLFSEGLLKPRRGDGGLRGEPRAKGRDGEDHRLPFRE